MTTKRNVVLTEDLMQRLDREAAMLGDSRSSIIRRACYEWLMGREETRRINRQHDEEFSREAAEDA